jgi:hypothetical protein
MFQGGNANARTTPESKARRKAKRTEIFMNWPAEGEKLNRKEESDHKEKKEPIERAATAPRFHLSY